MADELRPIIERAKRGDREALDKLAGCADRFLRIFSGQLSRRVRRARGSTIDFVLEGLAEALASLPANEFPSDEAFYAWVGRHIRHRIIDAHRAEGRAKRGEEPVPLGGAEGRSPGELPAGGSSPSQIVSAVETLRALASAILAVHVDHPREMEAVVMKVFEGQTFPEIAGKLCRGSEKAARILFAGGLDLLRPRVRRLAGSDDRPGRFPLDLEGGAVP